MKLIRFAFINLVVFCLLLTGISFLFPSHIHISKAIDITASKDSLLLQIHDVTNWKNWYPGADTAELIFENGIAKGITTQKGQSLKITVITDSSVSAVNSGTASKESEIGWNIYPGSTPNSYTVQWYMVFHLRWYPWEKFSSLLLEKRYGTMMELGLEKLKAWFEK